MNVERSAPRGAVFLSYASQDAAAARRICEALRGAGVEVWFDQNELVGGDAWDQKIKKQIRECALFVPLISANTNARLEGYFRREWKLAVERTHDMADEKAFLVPVVIDATTDAAASVPEKFREVQWTRLREGETPPAFCARVQTLLGGAPAAPATSRSPVAEATPPAGPRWGWRVAWIGAGLAVVAAGLWLVSSRFSTPAPGVPAVTPAKGTAPAEKSIAVLPFANLSDDKENAYFADGVHEDILTHLANIPELRIVSRTSVQRYRGTAKPMREIATELGVTYILEGSVRRAGGTVRVTGQLIRAASDEHVWAQHYDRELKDVFAIQADLATEIARALRAAIDPAQQSRINRAATTVPGAYDLLLRARHTLNHNLQSSQEGFAKAEAFLRSAVELDPDFAVAWSYLADVHAQFYFQNYDRTEARRELARNAIDRAMQLDPDRAEVLRNCGAYYYHAWRDFPRAGEYYRRALALQPNDSETHLLLALQLRRLGDWRGMLDEARRAFELDPTNPSARAIYVPSLLGVARRYDEALRALAPLAQREKNPLAIVRVAPHVIQFFATGSTQSLAAYLDGLPPEQKSNPEYFSRRQQLALFLGNWGEAMRLADENQAAFEEPVLRAALLHGLGRSELARRELSAELDTVAERIKAGKDHAGTLKDRAMMAALAGQAESARTYLQEAQTKILATNDRMEAADLDVVAAVVLLWTGDQEGALRELAHNLATPGPHRLNIHEMRHSPLWAPLQGDSRFAALLNDPKNNAPSF